MEITTLVFSLLSATIIGGALIVAFSGSIVRSAFAMLAVFAGAAGIFLLLRADFVAVVQILIYVGGILVLFLFAVMLTSQLAILKASNPSKGRGAALVLAVILAGVLIYSLLSYSGPSLDLEGGYTTAAIGEALLSRYLLPFEIVSVLLVLALVGAAVLARREVKE